MAIISKGDLMLLLGDDLDQFTAFLFSTGGAPTKWQFEQAEGFELDSPVIQAKLQELNTAGVLSKTTMDKIAAWKAAQAAAPVSTPPTVVMIIVTLADSSANINTWLAQNGITPKEVQATRTKGEYLVSTASQLPGTYTEGTVKNV